MWYLYAMLGALMVAIMIALAWGMHELTQRQQRLAQAINDMPRHVAGDKVSAVPASIVAPWFDLPDLTGGRSTLSHLVGAHRPGILLFVDPRCAPCFSLLPDIGGWQHVYGDRRSFALVSGGDVDANRAMTAQYGIAPTTVLLQDGNETAKAFGVRMMPAAAVVQTDGRMAGEVVYGVAAVRQLMATTLGLAMPDPPAIARESTLAIGQRVPDILRPGLSGSVVSFAEAMRERYTLLLFWTPGCHHCQDLLPTMREWEASGDGPHLVIVSRGPTALIEQTGLQSPVILDDDQSVAAQFGVSSSPAGIAIDRLGHVASPIARGATNVQALAIALARRETAIAS